MQKKQVDFSNRRPIIILRESSCTGTWQSATLGRAGEAKYAFLMYTGLPASERKQIAKAAMAYVAIRASLILMNNKELT
jgi:hypothetical protein